MLPGVVSQNTSQTSKIDIFAHYSNVIIGKVASQITSLTIIYSTVYSGSV